MGKNDSLARQKPGEAGLDYSKIVQTKSFQELLRKKRNFILPMSIFFMVYYFTLPVMTAYSTVLNNEAFGGISWAWVFAFTQFIMTWTLCILYTKKAVQFDKIVDRVKEEAGN